MIYKRKNSGFIWTLTFLSFIAATTSVTTSTTLSTISSTISSTTLSSTSSTTLSSTSSTISSTTTSSPSSTTTSTAGTTTSANITSSTEVYTSSTGDQAVWMIVGVVCGVILVISILAIAIGVYAFHKSKRVHPHSDTESFCSESESGTRPTTASHIFIEPEEEEAMSKPVTMTPFELRKLYVETFPYKNWKKAYDGSLRPQMSLTFVDPKLYARSRGDEKHFREKIYNYENSDSLTLRSSALSRMMHHNVMPTMHEMDPVYEQPLPPIRGEPPTQEQLPKTDRSESIKKSEDMELQ